MIEPKEVNFSQLFFFCRSSIIYFGSKIILTVSFIFCSIFCFSLAYSYSPLLIYSFFCSSIFTFYYFYLPCYSYSSLITYTFMPARPNSFLTSDRFLPAYCSNHFSLISLVIVVKPRLCLRHKFVCLFSPSLI